tara:strand:- start:1131 stop:1721 length:591 start_codon:yes stop_codon:yes gene_type:complete
MANNDNAFGLKPTRMIGGASYNGSQSRYRIANDYNTSIFTGDLVQQDTNGTITRWALGSNSGADLVLGVFMGCRFTDPSTKKETFQDHYTQTAADDIEAFIVDDPNVIFEIQADAAFPVTDLFGNFNTVDTTSGSTVTGLSGTELAVSTGGTGELPLKAIDISTDPDNSDVATAHTNVLVMITNHVYGGNFTAGLA